MNGINFFQRLVLSHERPLSRPPYPREKGQTIIAVVFLLSVTSLMVLMLFNNSRQVQDKTLMVNAADAAAYSAGMAVARELNMMAYNNRAIIANHLIIGHLASYKSWTSSLRKVGEAAANNPNNDGLEQILNDFGQLAGINGFGNNIGNQGDRIRDILAVPDLLAGVRGAVHAASVREVMNLISQSSALSRAQLSNDGADPENPQFLQGLMTNVANTYANSVESEGYGRGGMPIRINDPITIASVMIDDDASDELKLVIEGIENQYQAMTGMIAESNPLPNFDGGRMSTLVTQSMQRLDSAQWFINRANTSDEYIKSGSTFVANVNGLLDWRTQDDTELIGSDFNDPSSVTGQSLCEGIDTAIDELANFVNDLNTNLPGQFQGAIADVANVNQNAVCNGGLYQGVNIYYHLADIPNSNRLSQNRIKLVAVASRNRAENLEAGVGPRRLSRFMVSVSAVEVVYQAPGCVAGSLGCSLGWGGAGSNEDPNLFNPYWQARLVDPKK